MGNNNGVLNNDDNNLVDNYKDRSIKHSITTRLEFNINIAGTEFHDLEEAINHAYRCGLAESYQIIKSTEQHGAVDQDELYKILKTSHSLEHKSDFLREIAKEWFPLELHEDKKIKTVNLELNELADYLKK
jgi:hypothetical protein